MGSTLGQCFAADISFLKKHGMNVTRLHSTRLLITCKSYLDKVCTLDVQEGIYTDNSFIEMCETGTFYIGNFDQNFYQI